jgi:ferric-dicitrate binding protein FerR (iron transport regulator)
MKREKDILIGKILSGNASLEEQKQLEKWLEEDPSHRGELEEMKKLWAVSSRLIKKERSYDAAEAWEEFRELAKAKPKIRTLYLRPLAIAAGLALIVSTVLVIRFFLSEPASDTLIVREQVQILMPSPLAQAAIADTATATVPSVVKPAKVKREKQLAMTSIYSGDSAGIYILPDGSKVYLNKNSSLAYSNNGRNIELEGEAFFEVLDNALPFYVTCKTTVTRAIGTSFNVKGYAQDKAVEVMVVTGQVEVSDKKLESNKILLNAGDLGLYGSDQVFVKSKSSKKSKWWKKGGLRSRIKSFFGKLRGKTE